MSLWLWDEKLALDIQCFHSTLLFWSVEQFRNAKDTFLTVSLIHLKTLFHKELKFVAVFWKTFCIGVKTTNTLTYRSFPKIFRFLRKIIKYISFQVLIFSKQDIYIIFLALVFVSFAIWSHKQWHVRRSHS